MARLEMTKQHNPNKAYPPEFARLVKSYRSKIRRYVEPGTTFSLELVAGCEMDALLDYVNHHMSPEMEWSGYGTRWCFANRESPKSYDLSNSEQFMSYFNHVSFRPVLVEDMEGI